MEADWEVEIGPGAPIVEAFWPGFVDLRSEPRRIGEIEEATRFPELAKALLQLNGQGSGNQPAPIDDAENGLVWTSKCDIWRLNSRSDSDQTDQIDPDEMDAAPEESVVGLACYVDLLPRSKNGFGEFDKAEKWVRAKVGRLRKTPVRCCRADLVVRVAAIGTRDGFAVTAYISACGADDHAAGLAFGSALAAFVSAIMNLSNAPAGNQSSSVSRS